MTEACRHALGGAIPCQRRAARAPNAPPPVPPAPRRAVSLVDKTLLDPAAWAVKYQGARGTCNAFAVNAAEELYAKLQTPSRPVLSLSEEFLYGMVRKIGYDDPRLDLGLTEQEIAKREKTGVTYLAQARLALMDHGVCAQALAPYTQRKPVNYFQTAFSQDAIADAATRRVDAADLLHFIVEPGPEDVFFGTERDWEPPLEKDGTAQSCSDVIHAALMQSIPVMAGFGILSHVGFAAWFGLNAMQFGTVAYPSDKLAAQDRLGPAGGHAICIVGYEPGRRAGDGWFLFRNSFGAFGFAQDRDRDNLPPKAPARGYGYIHEQDVDRYCWEILHRAHPPHALS